MFHLQTLDVDKYAVGFLAKAHAVASELDAHAAAWWFGARKRS